MNKIGRNDSCPCNSGKKYKKCHGNPAYTPPPPQPQYRARRMEAHEMPPEVARLQGQRREDQEYTRQFGHVRPLKALEVNGYKLVIARGAYSNNPPTERNTSPTSFSTLSPPSLDASGLKLEKQSPEVRVIRSWPCGIRSMTYMNKQEMTPDGIYVSRITGSMLGYFARGRPSEMPVPVPTHSWETRAEPGQTAMIGITSSDPP